MKPFAKVPSEMPRSGIRDIMDRSANVPNCIHLEVGQPDFPTPPHVLDALCQSARNGRTTYGPNAGVNELRDAAARMFQRKTGVPTSRENIVCTIGGVGSFLTAMMALCDPGDEVLLPDPGWPNHGMAALVLGAKVVNYSLRPEDDFTPDLDELERLVNDRTKALLVCSPSNPTGQVYSAETIRQILDLCRRHDIYLLSDEIYGDICFDAPHASALISEVDQRLLVLSGVSKAYAMTGFRVGFTRASPQYVTLATKLQEPTVSCGAPFAQLAAAAAIDGPQDIVATMREAYKTRRDAALEILRDYDLYQYTPGGAFYLLVDVSRSGLNGYEFALKLLDEKGVAVSPGPTFGRLSEHHVRISFAASKEHLCEGIDRLCGLIRQLS